MDYVQYYKNHRNNQCVTIPSRQSIKNYLIKENYLSEFSNEDEINEVLNNLGITTKLDILKQLIDNKVIESGSLPWDLIPTSGHTQHILSSDAIYKVLSKYYSKNDIDNKIQMLWDTFITNDKSNIEIDSELSDTSENPLQNKKIKELLDNKVDYSILSNYVTLLELNNKINSINKDLQKGKGYYNSYDELLELVPNPSIGDWAIVSVNDDFYIAVCNTPNSWTLTSQQYEFPEISLSQYATKDELSKKQDELIPNVNIKTINGESILGPGNISLTGGENVTTDSSLSDDSTNPVQNKVIKAELDNKVNYSDLQNYPTNQEVEQKISNINNKLEKGKGYFTSVNALKALCPTPKVGDWAIVNKDNKWVVASCQVDGVWTVTEQEYDSSDINLEEYAKKEDLDLKQDTLINGVSIKTINGQNILGSGNIQIIGGDIDPSIFDNYMTKDEYYNIQNPLRVSLSSNPTLAEYTGNSINVTLSYSVSKGGNQIVPETLELTIGGNKIDLTPSKNGTYVAKISNKGTTTFSIKATKNNESNSASASTNLVLPSYIGFDVAESVDNVNFYNLTKEIKNTISNTKTIENRTSGSYLWIISPYVLNRVATDSGFTYVVNMQSLGNTGGLNYYRSVRAVDVSNLTYYVK